jgi:hypothetical protein
VTTFKRYLGWFALGGVVLALAAGLAFAWRAVAIVLGVLLAWAAGAVAYDRWRADRLRRAFLARWAGEGKRTLLVYSQSPNWQAYVETRWLPRLHDRVVTLNWSERRRWPAEHPLEAAVFRHYAGTREFNPLALVFPESGGVQIIRFWQAFRDYKHGKERALRAAEQALFTAVGGESPHVGA